MNSTDKQEFKELIKEGTIEAITSEDGRQVIKEGALEALKSDEGRQVIKDGTLEALGSDEGQEVIKQGSIAALNSQEGKLAIVTVLKSPEAKEVFLENFTEAFHDVVAPILDSYDERTKRLETKVGVST